MVAGWLDDSTKEREAVIYMTVAWPGKWHLLEKRGEAGALSQSKYCLTKFK